MRLADVWIIAVFEKRFHIFLDVEELVIVLNFSLYLINVSENLIYLELLHYASELLWQLIYKRRDWGIRYFFVEGK